VRRPVHVEGPFGLEAAADVLRDDDQAAQAQVPGVARRARGRAIGAVGRAVHQDAEGGGAARGHDHRVEFHAVAHRNHGFGGCVPGVGGGLLGRDRDGDCECDEGQQ